MVNILKHYNYKIKRNLLFEYISSIELDLREFIRINNVDVDVFKEKIMARIKQNGDDFGDDSYNVNKLFYLDFGDYVQLINSHFKSKTELFKKLINDLEKITPIRNRVMHSRPLHLDDDLILQNFVNNYNNYSSIIVFDHLIDSMKMIENNPNYFYDKTPDFNVVYIGKSIEHNLPMVDYDDTGFVGREDAKKQIIKKLKSAYPIISIIGDGGIGKTSTVLSCIYDIIDENDFGFEKVIWVTLKTKSLQDGEFRELKNSMKSFGDCLNNNEILKKENMTTIESLLFYMQVYKTLFILDNLETINSDDIKELFEDLPMGSKILITSRIGIGEYETRMTLPKFTQNEAMAYFRKLVSVYNASVLSKISNLELIKYLDKLYYSPLCIKWFVINVAKGNSPDIVINGQEELIEFCLSNVYDKLSSEAKNILLFLLVKQSSCSIAELVYLNNQDYNHSITAINELYACNFLEQVAYGVYYVPEFARKYLNKRFNKGTVETIEIQKKINKLVGTLENLKSDIHLKDKNHPLSFFPKDNSEKIATIYMLKFIEASKVYDENEMEQCYDAATKAAPKYSDMYKVAGYLYGKNKNDIRAKECYDLAREYASTILDRAYVDSFYASYLLSVRNDYVNAKILLDEAMDTIPNNPYFISNYARLLKYEKDFQEASNLIISLLDGNYELNDILKKNLYSEYVDIQARYIDYTHDDDVRHKLINDVLKYIDNIYIEYFSLPLYNAFSKLLKYMLFLHGRKPMKRAISSFINKYFIYILFANNKQNEAEILVNNINDIVDKKIDLDNYREQIPKVEVGTIRKFYADKGYGFISIKKWSTNIFFHISNVTYNNEVNIQVGQRVSFIPYYFNKKWQAISIDIFGIESNENED